MFRGLRHTPRSTEPAPSAPSSRRRYHRHPYSQLPGRLLASFLWLGSLLSPVSAAPVLSSAVVIEILDGDEMYIETVKARIRSRANNPQRISTRDSRGQMTFNTGAVGRINRFSQIRLGAQCFLLSGGQILISGNQNGCVRSARMSVRGTHYVMTRDAREETTVHGLEGEIMVERLGQDGEPTGDPPTRLPAGWKLRLSTDGSVLALQRIPFAELQSLLEGPLFQGFQQPLAGAAALQLALARLYPGLTTGRARCTGTDRTLMASINAARIRAGRSPLPGLPEEQSQANCTYLEPILRRLMASSDCSHNIQLWEAFQREAQRRFGRQPTSEVIACPRSGTAWDPTLIIDTWLSSSLHQDILLNRTRATHVDCVRFDQGDRSVGVCTFWSDAFYPLQDR